MAVCAVLVVRNERLCFHAGILDATAERRKASGLLQRASWEALEIAVMRVRDAYGEWAGVARWPVSVSIVQAIEDGRQRTRIARTGSVPYAAGG